MHKLTNKNYSNLPEVKKKREEDAKKEEKRKRLADIKEKYGKNNKM